jgi:hypothetical protein
MNSLTEKKNEVKNSNVRTTRRCGKEFQHIPMRRKVHLDVKTVHNKFQVNLLIRDSLVRENKFNAKVRSHFTTAECTSTDTRVRMQTNKYVASLGAVGTKHDNSVAASCRRLPYKRNDSQERRTVVDT